MTYECHARPGWNAMFLMTIMAAVLTTSPAAPVAIEFSPGCEDEDESTACCPLEDLELIGKSPADWYACLDSATLPIHEATYRDNEE